MVGLDRVIDLQTQLVGAELEMDDAFSLPHAEVDMIDILRDR